MVGRVALALVVDRERSAERVRDRLQQVGAVLVVQRRGQLVVVEAEQGVGEAVTVDVLEVDAARAARLVEPAAAADDEVAGDEAERADVDGRRDAAADARGAIEGDVLAAVDARADRHGGEVAVVDLGQQPAAGAEAHLDRVRRSAPQLVEDAVAVDVAPRVRRPVVVEQQVDPAAELGVGQREAETGAAGGRLAGLESAAAELDGVRR